VRRILFILRLKGETVEEITGCARVMRDKAMFINTPPGAIPVDTAGTGNDSVHTFNISTTAAFVAAGAGVVMAKNGNQAASSTCGSASLLEALGVNIGLEPAELEASIREVGMGFLFAPVLHGAMRPRHRPSMCRCHCCARILSLTHISSTKCAGTAQMPAC